MLAATHAKVLRCTGEDPRITFGFAARGGFETAIVQKLYRDDRDRRALSGLNQVRRQQGEAMDYDWPAVLEPGVYREPIGTPGEENSLLAHPSESLQCLAAPGSITD